MSALFDVGQKVLMEQPFSVLLGAELESFVAGEAVLTLTVHDNLKQQHGFVHGGVISYLADNALTFAGGSVLGNAVTSEFKINYVRPAVGEKLIARATVLSSGKRQAVCECKVFILNNACEVMVAVAQGTISKVERLGD